MAKVHALILNAEGWKQPYITLYASDKGPIEALRALYVEAVVGDDEFSDLKRDAVEAEAAEFDDDTLLREYSELAEEDVSITELEVLDYPVLS